RVRIRKIDVALGVLRFGGPPSSPGTSALSHALDRHSGDLEASLAAFHADMLLALAKAEATTASSRQRDNAAATPAGLTKAYEVGRLLGGIATAASHDDT